MKQVQITKPLNLTNDGKLELFFIGTGTPFTKKLFNNNFLLIKGNTHIMVDFGMTAPIAIREVAGLTPEQINVILPTHSHSDHIGGLEYLALYKRYIGFRNNNISKIDMIITPKYQKAIWDYSLRGGMEWNETNNSNDSLSFNDYFEVYHPNYLSHIKRETYSIDFGGIKLEIFKTNHIPDSANNLTDAYISYGLFADDKILISCDTKFDKDLFASYADRSEFIFHDCSFFHNPVHTSIHELRTLPDEIKAKIFLMHYSDDWANHDISGFAGLAHQGISYIFD
jgi:ribonuclease BN (tRNA processing enzyme)